MHPVATAIGASPIKTILVSGERLLEKINVKTMFGISNISEHAVDYRVGANNERLLNKSHAWIVKHPHAVMLVWRDYGDCVHWMLKKRDQPSLSGPIVG